LFSITKVVFNHYFEFLSKNQSHCKNPDRAGAVAVIAHVDLDAFYASVEQRDHPEWRGKPVIVGSAPDERGVVSTCSYEVRCNEFPRKSI
jgi:hypothetical protein